MLDSNSARKTSQKALESILSRLILPAEKSSVSARNICQRRIHNHNYFAINRSVIALKSLSDLV